MGNSNQIESHNFSDQSLKDFKNNTIYVRDSDDPCFGEIQIFERKYTTSSNPQEQLVFQKVKFEPNKLEYNELYRECDLRLSYSHQNLLDFLGYDFKCSKNLCSTSNRSTLYFQYFDRDLEHELNKRQTDMNYYSEIEILYILESLASVGSYLQNQHIYHGDLRPCNIFVTPTGKVKIGDHLLLNQYRNNYIKALVQGNQNVFLSPQLMFSLNALEKEPEYDEFKADVWSLGMTILEICSLCPSIQCYDFNDNTISYSKIQDLLTKASQFYSFSLISKIQSMLEEDERIRPDMIQLNAMFGGTNRSSLVQHSRYNSQFMSPPKQQQLVQASRIQTVSQATIPVRQQQQQQLQATQVIYKQQQVNGQNVILQHQQPNIGATQILQPQSRVISNIVDPSSLSRPPAASPQRVIRNVQQQPIIQSQYQNRQVLTQQQYQSMQLQKQQQSSQQQQNQQQNLGGGDDNQDWNQKYDFLQSRIQLALEETKQTIQKNEQTGEINAQQSSYQQEQLIDDLI